MSRRLAGMASVSLSFASPGRNSGSAAAKYGAVLPGLD